MGAIHKLIHDIKLTNERIGGARCTRVARARNATRFAKWYNAHAPHKASRLGDIDAAVLVAYTDTLKVSLAPGSVHNHLSSLRQLLRAAKVDISACQCNGAVGAEPRNRKGTKLPYPDDLMDDLLQRAYLLDIGFYHVLKIERLLGCRGLEALMSTASIAGWIDELDYYQSVAIKRGTKGGRSRVTEVIKDRAEETRQALVAALDYINCNQFLIRARNEGLGPARGRYHRLARQLGLVGQYAPHSLRYAWACEKILELIAAGLPRNEILSFVSNTLGHGSGRGRWVNSVYGASVTHLLPRPSRRITQLYELAKTMKELPDRS